VLNVTVCAFRKNTEGIERYLKSHDFSLNSPDYGTIMASYRQIVMDGFKDEKTKPILERHYDLYHDIQMRIPVMRLADTISRQNLIINFAWKLLSIK